MAKIRHRRIYYKGENMKILTLFNQINNTPPTYFLGHITILITRFQKRTDICLVLFLVFSFIRICAP